MSSDVLASERHSRHGHLPSQPAAEPADLVSVHDTRGRVRLLSPGWADLLGEPAARSLLGRDLLGVAHPDDRVLIADAQAAIVSQDRQVVVEFRLQTPGGPVPVEAVGRPPLPGQRTYVLLLRRLG